MSQSTQVYIDTDSRLTSHLYIRNHDIRNHHHYQDVSNTGMDDFGIQEICEGLKKNSSVTALNVSRNNFSVKVRSLSMRLTSSAATPIIMPPSSLLYQGVQYIERMLGRNSSLKSLDISRNALGFHSINTLQCCCAAKRLTMNVEGKKC